MATIKGGDKIGPKLLAMAKKLQSARSVQVGFLENATYPNGTPVAMVAAIQNFGAPARRIPPRPFFSNMIVKKKDEWGPAIGNLLIANDYDASKTLRLTGEAIAGQLRESIVDTNSPPLSPVTLMLRKMQLDDTSLVVTGKTVGIAAAKVAAGDSYAGAPTKPLVWTSHMINSVDYEVKD